ncbi:hypothetical protein [Pseudomonas putida]|uniref:Uncharacterized protein n=1 Tax=Pseudomonas putida TaxID=303 RepID=A0A8I1EAT3_PSEPU|nr:hypothetical protein [Pseudomonas putida]MBI6883050.1 hypothetical protein [Pseudomonas putida]
MTNTLITGAPLNVDTFSDFVGRLKQDCIGEGLAEHCTSDVVFIVKEKEILYGVDTDYTDNLVIFYEDTKYHSISQLLSDHGDGHLAKLNEMALGEFQLPFSEIGERDQFLLAGSLPGFTTHGYSSNWKFLNLHLTQSSADWYIKKHGHKHDGELQVFHESQYRCHEFNTIKEALMNGNLVWKE